MFLQHLAATLPSISIVTHGDYQDRYGLHEWAQQARRGFPLLLLDCPRPRS